MLPISSLFFFIQKLPPWLGLVLYPKMWRGDWALFFLAWLEGSFKPGLPPHLVLENRSAEVPGGSSYGLGALPQWRSYRRSRSFQTGPSMSSQEATLWQLPSKDVVCQNNWHLVFIFSRAVCIIQATKQLFGDPWFVQAVDDLLLPNVRLYFHPFLLFVKVSVSFPSAAFNEMGILWA